MVYTRGAASDYDDWETEYGNTGWGSKHLIPLLKKVQIPVVDVRYLVLIRNNCNEGRNTSTKCYQPHTWKFGSSQSFVRPRLDKYWRELLGSCRRLR